MILRALELEVPERGILEPGVLEADAPEAGAPEPGAPQRDVFVPVWPAIERVQRRRYASCRLITQPSHAALAGEIAARLNIPGVPAPGAGLIQAIALHDAGWGLPDAQAIQQSRAAQPGAQASYQPKSFLETSVAEYLGAWSKSIETAQSVSPAGGYIVSRHFYLLAEHRVASGNDAKQDRQKLEAFLAGEARRQQKLASRQPLQLGELEVFTGLLQLCDLLSLYICSGARENVVFPECFGMRLRIARQASGLWLDPPLLPGGARFAVATLLHPPEGESSGREMVVRIL